MPNSNKVINFLLFAIVITRNSLRYCKFHIGNLINLFLSSEASGMELCYVVIYFLFVPLNSFPFIKSKLANRNKTQTNHHRIIKINGPLSPRRNSRLRRLLGYKWILHVCQFINSNRLVLATMRIDDIVRCHWRWLLFYICLLICKFIWVNQKLLSGVQCSVFNGKAQSI